MPCIDCAHGALRDAKDQVRDRALRGMAKRGFVNCTRSDQRATFHAADHTCEGWAALEEQLGAARRNWLASQTREHA